MEKRFREHGIKITPQRLELIRTLKKLEKTHPSFSEIYNTVKTIQPSVSKSTVYENLKLLVKLGIIKGFHYNGEIHYEMNYEPHVNLVEFNGKIRDIKNDEIKKHLSEIERIINEREGIKIKTMMVIVE